MLLISIMSQTMSQTMSQSNMSQPDWAAIEEKTLHKLRVIFHMQLLTMNIVNCNTKEKMMDMLNTQGDPIWTPEYILELATDNKIKWVKGSSDPTPYDTYQEQMNARLAEILRG